MKKIIDIYNELKKDYMVKWYESEFELYFFNKHMEYKIYVNEEFVSISRIRKIKFFKFQLKYETPISHAHFDSDTYSVDDIYNKVLFYLNKYRK